MNRLKGGEVISKGAPMLSTRVSVLTFNLRLCVTLGMLLCVAGAGAQTPDTTSAQVNGIDPALLAKAQAGDAIAQYNLGLLYHEGQGVPKDYAEAATWWRKAADQGDATAQWSLGTLYNFGQGVPRDYRQAAFWYLQAADQGNAEAQVYLGQLYDLGQGVQQDYTQAAVWYRKSADQGNANAQFALAKLYFNGDGLPKDEAIAVVWTRKAAEQGLASAQVALGLSYEAGRGLPQDYAEAAFWYRKAAAQGNATAQHCLGLLYYKGKGVHKDRAQAAEWERKSTEQRDSTAELPQAVAGFLPPNPQEPYGEPPVFSQVRADLIADLINKASQSGGELYQERVGDLYEKGEGLGGNPDYGLAAAWYHRAAVNGVAGAQNSLGVLYVRGAGVPLDYGQAAALFQQAADKGLANAQYNLAVLYYSAEGVPQNFSEAYFWFDLAMSGNVDGVKPAALAKYRDLAASHLTKTVLLQTQERARKWFEDHATKTPSR